MNNTSSFENVTNPVADGIRSESDGEIAMQILLGVLIPFVIVIIIIYSIIRCFDDGPLNSMNDSHDMLAVSQSDDAYESQESIELQSSQIEVQSIE